MHVIMLSMKNDEEKIIADMQLIVEQMKIDDIEDNPDIVNDLFDCDCCGKTKSLAGSIQYKAHRLCNDCVLYAEIGFALNKIENIDELLQKFEDKKLEEICNFIKQDEQASRN